MRRKDRELSRDEALKIIDECEYAVISCVLACRSQSCVRI